VYCAVLCMNLIDVSAVNVALPALGRSFGVSAADAEAVSVSYLFGIAALIPSAGVLGARFGGRRVLVIAIAVFTLASVACSCAGSLSMLVAMRFIQGGGGGLLLPVGMALLYELYPVEERVRITGTIVIVTATGPALGPVVGGVLTSSLSWRWVFYLNVPVGVLAVALVALFVSPPPRRAAERFDWFGFGLVAVGLCAVMFGLSALSRNTGATGQGVAGLLSGALLLVGFWRRERSSRSPVVNVRLLHEPQFRACVVIVLITTAAAFGMVYAVPIFYQSGRGYSALVSGLSTFPEALGVMVGSRLVVRFAYRRLGPRVLMTAGLAGVAAFAGAWASLAHGATNLWILRLFMFGFGFCVPHAMMSTQAAGFAYIAGRDLGHATMIFNISRQLGGAVGVVLASTALTLRGPLNATGPATDFAAYQLAFCCLAVVAAAGSVLSPWMLQPHSESFPAYPSIPPAELEYSYDNNPRG
jgi:EmrB/QacA subfamily drug resistance transporter